MDETQSQHFVSSPPSPLPDDHQRRPCHISISRRRAPVAHVTHCMCVRDRPADPCRTTLFSAGGPHRCLLQTAIRCCSPPLLAWSSAGIHGDCASCARHAVVCTNARAARTWGCLRLRLLCDGVASCFHGCLLLKYRLLCTTSRTTPCRLAVRQTLTRAFARLVMPQARHDRAYLIFPALCPRHA